MPSGSSSGKAPYEGSVLQKSTATNPRLADSDDRQLCRVGVNESKR
jgi:hypothetical protein